MRWVRLRALCGLTLSIVALWFGSTTIVAAQASDSAGKQVALIGTRWKLIDLQGKPVRKEGDGLSFALQQVETFRGGSTGRLVSPLSDGCNDLTGTYKVDGQSLEVHFVTSTLVACASPGVVRHGDHVLSTAPVDPHKRFVDALHRTSSFDIHGSTLELMDWNGTVVARLTANQD